MIFPLRISKLLVTRLSEVRGQRVKKKALSRSLCANSLHSNERHISGLFFALPLLLSMAAPSFAWTNISMRFETQQRKVNLIRCRFDGAIRDIVGPVEIQPQMPGYQGFYLESVAPDHSFASLRRLLTGMTCSWEIPNPANFQPNKANIWYQPSTHQQLVDLKNLIPTNVIDDLLIDRPPTQHKALKLLLYFSRDRITVKWDTESWNTKPLPAGIHPVLPQR